jgi:hypothetical protein
MSEENITGALSPNGRLDAQLADPQLLEAVNRLVWLIADEFVDAAYEGVWLRQMLPEPKKLKTRTAGKA